MAEERLIDDDKDKKYKIRVNADGEEEVYIDKTEEDDEPEEMEVLEFEVDDEEAAVMTPEQLAAREKAKAEEAEKRAKMIENAIAEAELMLSESDFDGALYALSKVEDFADDKSEIAVLKLKAHSRNMTDFTFDAECAQAAQKVNLYATEEQKAELFANAKTLSVCINGLQAETEKLNSENEAKKSERRQIFTKRRKKAAIWLGCTGIPFIALLIIAVYFATVIYAIEDGTNIIYTIVFAALAGIFFIATLFTLRKFWAAQRNLLMNEKNTSTKLGREYEAKKQKLENLQTVYAAIKAEQ